MSKRIALCLLALCVALSGCGSASKATDLAQTECSPQTVEATELPSTDSTLALDGTGASRSGRYAYAGDLSKAVTDGLTYFVFSQNTTTYSDDDGESLLLEMATTTTFYAQCEIQSLWVNDILSDLETKESNYGKELLGYARQDRQTFPDHFYCYSHYVTRGVARHDTRVISLLSQTMVYSGGAHPTTVQTAYNLDMQKLTILSLEDVIESDACETLRTLVLNRVEEKYTTISDVVLFDDYQSVISEALTYGKMTPYWYFNDQGLVIFFNQYELAPYAAGIIKIEIGYDKLNGILKEEFMPESRQDGAVTLSVSEEPYAPEDVYDVVLGEGSTTYLTVSGTAYHIQLSEVNLVEQTAVSSTMLFSANYLNEETPLAVTGEPDPEKSYAIAYYAGSGEQAVLYYYDDTIVLEPNNAQSELEP